MKFLASFLVALAVASKTVTAYGPVLSVHGSGTTNPSKCYWNVMDMMQARAKLPLHMTYRAIGSGGGQTEFTNPGVPVTAFGSGDIPLKKEYYDQFQAEGVTVLQLPVFVSAVTFFHNVPDTPTLNLTACTLASIFKREITSWDDEQIKKLNPDLKLPGGGGLPIRVARRVDGSSSTSGSTAVRIYLNFVYIRICAHTFIWSIRNLPTLLLASLLFSFGLPSFLLLLIHRSICPRPAPRCGETIRAVRLNGPKEPWNVKDRVE